MEYHGKYNHAFHNASSKQNIRWLLYEIFIENIMKS